MNFESSRHCKLIRSIGVPLGLWPYRRTILGKMNGAIALIISILCIVAQLLAFPLHDNLLGAVKGMFNSRGYLQLAVFITHEFSLDLFLMSMVGIVPPTVYVVKYLYFMWNMEQVKDVFEWIQSDYDSLTDERELRLIEKFADRGTIMHKLGLYCFLLILVPVGFPLVLEFFNIETFVNQSRPVLIIFNVEYFVDQDRYFYLILFHIAATTFLGASIVLFTEFTIIYFITHACGLLEVIGDRVERVFESSILNVLRGRAYLAVHGQLVATITLHQRTLKFIEKINTSLLPQYCILIVICVVSLSINLCTVAKAILMIKYYSELLIALTMVAIHFIYIGCGSYVSQILLDTGDDLFTKTYYARWHEAPLPIQKMLFYMRQRSMQPTGLVVGGLYTGSFEFFSKVVNVSMSYFMVLFSTA